MALKTNQMRIVRSPWAYLSAFRIAITVLCFVFLILPLLVIVPLSFNVEPYFTFTEGMLSLDPDAYSVRWYEVLFDNEEWGRALGNSLFIGVCATLLATTLGTLAAIALSNDKFPARRTVTALLISPMVTPIIIVGVGSFFFYSHPSIGLAQTHLGIILTHTILGAPFVVITVSATLAGFDQTYLKAAASLGAGAFTRFRRIQLPLIAPGVITGGLFAFAASFDELVVVLFMGGVEQRTIPRQMWSGIREELNPTILAVATLLILFAIVFLFVVEWLRGRSARLGRLDAV